MMTTILECNSPKSFGENQSISITQNDYSVMQINKLNESRKN